jgi:LacI family transcriptional regulator
MNLRALAAELGLSQTTVSRALNGYPEVAESTRRRVEEAARRLNYRPDMRAKGLATGRTMAIGHILPVSSRHEIVNPVFADFIAGAGETYARHGYDLLLSVVRDEDEARHYRDVAAKRSVDGLIVHAPRAEDRRIALLRDTGLPFVVHGRVSDETLPYAFLDIDNRRAFERATHFLIDLGHRRIALVNGLASMDFAIRRRNGYLAALAARGLPADPALIRSDEMTESFGFATARDLLALPDPPTAFLTSSLIVAMGVRRAADAAGIAVPRDLSIVTHDDELAYLRNGSDEPIYTATRSSVREAGRRAAEMLMGMIADPGHPLPQRILEADLVLGRSTGPAPGHVLSPARSPSPAPLPP